MFCGQRPFVASRCLYFIVLDLTRLGPTICAGVGALMRKPPKAEPPSTTVRVLPMKKQNMFWFYGRQEPPGMSTPREGWSVIVRLRPQRKRHANIPDGEGMVVTALAHLSSSSISRLICPESGSSTQLAEFPSKLTGRSSVAEKAQLAKFLEDPWHACTFSNVSCASSVLSRREVLQRAL